MSIDMKNFAGATEPAAEVQQGVNSYQNETSYEEVSVDQGILEQVRQDNPPEPAPNALEAPLAPSSQELNFKALREEVDRIKAERDEFRQNLDVLRANQVRQEPVQEPKKFLDGMGDHEVPNVAEIRRAFEQREQQYQMRLEELQVQQSHPDYAEVLEKYTAPLLKQKPYLAEGIMGSSNKALFAYELGKMAQQRYEPPASQPQQSANAQKMVENARKPGPIGQRGGQSVLGQADYYATMSDAEFMRMASKNLEGI